MIHTHSRLRKWAHAVRQRSDRGKPGTFASGRLADEKVCNDWNVFRPKARCGIHNVPRVPVRFRRTVSLDQFTRGCEQIEHSF